MPPHTHRPRPFGAELGSGAKSGTYTDCSASHRTVLIWIDHRDPGPGNPSAEARTPRVGWSHTGRSVGRAGLEPATGGLWVRQPGSRTIPSGSAESYRACSRGMRAKLAWNPAGQPLERLAPQLAPFPL